jgi:hypothetical protein
MLKTSDRASFLKILFQFLKNYVFVVLPSDTFALFHRHFYSTPAPEKKIAYKTFFAFKDHLAISGRFLCLEA